MWQVKALAVKLDDISSVPGTLILEGEKLTLSSCPLASVHGL